PYTRALLSAVPIPDPEIEARREHIVLGGEVPSPLNPPPGCVFHPRCPIAIDQCRAEVPALREIRSAHLAACIRAYVTKAGILEGARSGRYGTSASGTFAPGLGLIPRVVSARDYLSQFDNGGSL